jgi:ABC-type nitrate/sulfonate/bicarbonate transport system permease component
MNQRSVPRDALWIKVAIPAASFGVLLLAWVLLARLSHIPSYVLPSPNQTFQAVRADWQVLSSGLVITAKEFVVGFVVGIVAGFGLAVGMSHSRWVMQSLYPILIASQAIPIIAIGAALVIWLGFGLAPKVAIVALIVFFPVLVNVLDGLGSVDQDSVNLARAMGASSWRIFRAIRLPATYTPLFSALKMSATFSVTGAVIGEQTASSTGGLGVYLTEQQSRLNTAGVFGDIILLAMLGISAFAIIALWEVIATPYRRRSTAPRRRCFKVHAAKGAGDSQRPEPTSPNRSPGDPQVMMSASSPDPGLARSVEGPHR